LTGPVSDHVTEDRPKPNMEYFYKKSRITNVRLTKNYIVKLITIAQHSCIVISIVVSNEKLRAKIHVDRKLNSYTTYWYRWDANTNLLIDMSSLIIIVIIIVIIIIIGSHKCIKFRQIDNMPYAIEYYYWIVYGLYKGSTIFYIRYSEDSVDNPSAAGLFCGANKGCGVYPVYVLGMLLLVSSDSSVGDLGNRF